MRPEVEVAKVLHKFHTRDYLHELNNAVIMFILPLQLDNDVKKKI